MLPWAAGALIISIYNNCDFQTGGFWEGEGGRAVKQGEAGGRGICGNSALAEVGFLGLSVGVICEWDCEKGEPLLSVAAEFREEVEEKLRNSYVIVLLASTSLHFFLPI